MSTLKEKTAKGLLWGGLSNGLQQLLNLVIGIFLARRLSEDDYGMVGMVTIFTALGACLQEGGFISALNKRKDATHRDFNAVFYTSVAIGLAFYTILFFCAPLISRFYGVPELTPLTRYVTLSFVISSFSTAPRAWLFRNMMVRETSLMTLIALAISGIVAIAMAYGGMAYWGIATQNIVYITILTFLSFYFSKWRPTKPEDFTPVREMIGFSSRLIITNVFTIINNNLFSVILGKLYTTRDVGNYTQANKWNTMGSSLISNIIYGVAQPVFTRVEDDRERQKAVLRKMLRFTALVTFPLMLGLSLVAKEFIVILIKEKWLDSAGILQMLCLAGAFFPICTLLSHLVISRGHSGAYMWATIGQCLAGLAVALSLSSFGIQVMIGAYVAVGILWTGVWLWLVHRETGLTLMEFLRDISPYLLLAALLCVGAHFAARGIDNIYLRFLAKVLLVAVPYIGVLWLLGSTILHESIKYLLGRLKIED
ncbi:MAG: lipopolysaccharide biosynthesis protein [Prevotella sp.]|nr:lipopolysaccharide biosynthesis protein [Prevotella sp.]